MHLQKYINQLIFVDKRNSNGILIVVPNSITAEIYNKNFLSDVPTFDIAFKKCIRLQFNQLIKSLKEYKSLLDNQLKHGITCIDTCSSNNIIELSNWDKISEIFLKRVEKIEKRINKYLKFMIDKEIITEKKDNNNENILKKQICAFIKDEQYRHVKKEKYANKNLLNYYIIKGIVSKITADEKSEKIVISECQLYNICDGEILFIHALENVDYDQIVFRENIDDIIKKITEDIEIQKEIIKGLFKMIFEEIIKYTIDNY